MAIYASNQLPKILPSFPVALVPITIKEANNLLGDLAIRLSDDTVLDGNDQVVIANCQGQWLMSAFLIEDNLYSRKPEPIIHTGKYGSRLYC